MKIYLQIITDPDPDAPYKPGRKKYYLWTGEEKYRLSFQWTEKFLALMKEVHFALVGPVIFMSKETLVPKDNTESKVKNLCQEFLSWRKKKRIHYWFSLLVT